MIENKYYYAVVESYVLYDKRLTSTEKIMYALIVALSQQRGYCYANIEHFTKVLNIKRRCVYLCIENLIKCNYITRSKKNNRTVLITTNQIFMQYRDNHTEQMQAIFDYDYLSENEE